MSQPAPSRRWITLLASAALVMAGACAKDTPTTPTTSPAGAALDIAPDTPPVVVPYTGSTAGGGTPSLAGTTLVTSGQNSQDKEREKRERERREREERERTREFQGSVTAVSTPARTFTVAGTTFKTDGDTEFQVGSRRGAFTDVAVGLRVAVKARSFSTGWLARTVKLPQTRPSRPISLRGTARDVSGTRTAFQFFVGTREVHGDSNTDFRGRRGFPQLIAGVRVHVKGIVKDSFVYATQLHLTGPGAPLPDPNDPDDIEDDPEGDIEDGGSTTTPEPPAPPSTPDPPATPEPPASPAPSEPPPPPAPAPTPVVAFNPQPIQGLGQCQTYTCGFRFTVTRDLDVRALGQWDDNLDGLVMNARVGLWTSDGTLVASVTVPSGTSAALTGEYRYVTITPVRLVAGQQYVIGSAYGMSGAPVVSASGADPAIVPTGGLTIARGTSVLAFPTTANASLFGGGNFLFVAVGP